MLRLSQGVEMADEITKYGFTPGPITKKELEPAPEPTPEPKPVPAVIVQQHPTTVQVVQQYPNAEKIILMLGHHSACCRDYVAEHGTVPGWCRVAVTVEPKTNCDSLSVPHLLPKSIHEGRNEQSS